MKSKIFNKKKVFIIGEAGVNHDGSLKKALKLVDIAAKAKVDAIKFQTFLPGELTGKFTPNVKYLKKNKIKRSELTKKLALKFSEFERIKKYCDYKKILFLSTPDGKKSLFFLTKKIKIPIIKIGSSEVTNHEFLKLIAKQNLPIIFSTGMSTLNEVKKSISIMKKFTKKEIIILHCTSEYPASITESNLKAILTLIEQFDCPIGFSDHTPETFASQLAVNLKGPDHKSSLSPKELEQYVKVIRNTEITLGSSKKIPTKSEIKNMPGVRRGIVASQFIEKNTILKKDMFTFKRPYKGINPDKISKLIGKKTTKFFKEDEPIIWKHLK